VAVETPVKLTDKQKELLREFEKSTTEGGAKHSPQTKTWRDKVKDFFE
jgi:molecular chaperone DnaJ